MTGLLRRYKGVLKRNIDVINAGANSSGEKVALLNICMQLRKAANHPYLFDGVEDRTLDPFAQPSPTLPTC